LRRGWRLSLAGAAGGELSLIISCGNQQSDARHGQTRQILGLRRQSSGYETPIFNVPASRNENDVFLA
jgi:hypothetical protein